MRIMPLVVALAITAVFILIVVYVAAPLTEQIVCHFMVGGC